MPPEDEGNKPGERVRPVDSPASDPTLHAPRPSGGDPSGDTVVPDRRLLHCPQCGLLYNVRNWSPDRDTFCPACSVRLSPPSAEISLDASRPQPIPIAPSAPSPRDREGAPFGRYRLLSELGHGGMGIVWRAWDTQLEREVALKQILSAGAADAEQVERFLREARAAARLRHPHIVGVLDVGVIDGQHYFTCDYIEGEALDRTAKREPLAPRRAVELVKAVAEALAYAHGQGVVHRDVKPANVLIDLDGHPHVMDFGLAKDIGKEATAGLTLSGDLLGTPAYMSPEQAAGRTSEIGPATDQFSLGVMLYSLLTGRLPFDETGLRELLNAILERDPIPPGRINPKIHRDVETICLRAMEKSPAKRYPSMAELAADLGRYLDGEPIRARPVSMLDRVIRRSIKNRAVLIPTAAAIVLALGVGIFALVSWIGKGRDIDRGLAEGRLFRDQGEPDKAWDAYQRVLSLDDADPEAIKGAAWAGAERKRRTAKQEAAQSQAVAEKAQAEASLEKAGKVQNVLARWMTLAEPLQAMEAAFYDSPSSLEKRRETAAPYWPRVEEFIRGTPGDPASQATMRAFAGWARRLAGYEEEGLRWMAEAREKDPDLPYGALLEAMVYFSRYLVQQPLPSLRLEELEMKFGEAPKETKRMLSLRNKADRLLSEAAKANVWGEGLAADFRAAVAAMQAVQGGRYEEAEAGLSAATESAALQVMKSDLLYARARCRYLSRRFADGISDLERIAKYRPNQAEVFGELSRERTALAFEMKRAGNGEWRTVFQKSLEEGRRSRQLSPGAATIFVAAGQSKFAWGDVGGAIQDYETAMEADPNFAPAYTSRAIARQSRGDLEGALADCVRALGLAPDDVSTLVCRGSVNLQRKAIPEALADFDRALAIDIECKAAHVGKGRARLEQGDTEAAMSEHMAALKIDPYCAEALVGKAEIWMARGNWKEALGACELVLGRMPTYVEPLLIRARALEKLGEIPRACSTLQEALARIAPSSPKHQILQQELDRLLKSDADPSR